MKLKLLTICLFFLVSIPVFSQQFELSTIFSKIKYKDETDVKEFNKKIKSVYPLKGLDVILNYKYENSFNELCRKIDGLILRVEEILDMHPVAFKINIKIFSSKKDMEKYFLKEFGYRKKDLIAFYVPAKNTIYVRIDKINEHILAHEIAHAVINRNFLIKPSEKIQELLCHYVDINLKKTHPENVPY